MMHLFRFLEIPQEHIYYADSISVFLASWRKFTQIYWILCLRRLSEDVSKAAKLHKALELAQAPRGEEHDLVLFRRQKFLHGSNVE